MRAIECRALADKSSLGGRNSTFWPGGEMRLICVNCHRNGEGVLGSNDSVSRRVWLRQVCGEMDFAVFNELVLGRLLV